MSRTTDVGVGSPRARVRREATRSNSPWILSVLLVTGCAGGGVGGNADPGDPGGADPFAEADRPIVIPEAGPDGEDRDGLPPTDGPVDGPFADPGEDAAGEAGPDLPLDCPGSFGCPCATGSDCFSNYCIEGMWGFVCSRACSDDSSCPDDWKCVLLGGAGDPTYVCVDPFSSLCRPCGADKDCEVETVPGAGNVCVDRGDAGSFCGVGCKVSDDCPDGFACEDVAAGARGGTSRQCVPADGAECPCTDKYKEKGYETACFVTNEHGRCAGERTCDAACDAPIPAAEACDGKDSDCDGATDEDVPAAPCNLTNPLGTCPGTTACEGGKEVCKGRMPEDERCNGVDDDCDSKTDEGWPDTDGDGIADCVEMDRDGDGVPDLDDNCPDDANADQLDTDLDGDGNACDPDDDGDGLVDTADNCPLVPNKDQVDDDGDLVGNACDCDRDGDGVFDATPGCPAPVPADNCPGVSNTAQTDLDGDTLGDACDCDLDGDGVENLAHGCGVPASPDNCPYFPNPGQADLDADLVGDACDCDRDGDGVPNAAAGCPEPAPADDCPDAFNMDQADLDADGTGDACDCDIDGDGVGDPSDGCPAPDPADNCPYTPNPDQADTSGTGIGDACNGDWDGDGVPDGDDNCPKTPNGDQADLDSDGTGDACDCDIDGDEDPNSNPGCPKPDVPDNCPSTANPGQEDLDLDGSGDACDPDRDGDQDPNDTDCRPDDASVFHGRPETCNGIDDDCDDGIDAADPDGVADGFLVADKPQCELRLGACAGSLKPAYLCVDGQFLACDDVAYRGHDPRFDGGVEVRCDGQDNDCDGTADEDFAVTLLDGTTVNGAGNTCGAGACSGGRTVCSADGKGIVCDSEPGAKPEVCDGKDNDCDGFNDASDQGAIANGFFVADPALCDEQRGACAGVIRPASLCVDGKWQPCPAAVYAAQSAMFEAGAETRCDGKDNDCDGGTDEDFSATLLDGSIAKGVGAACGTGRCAGGFTACAADGKGVFCPSEAASEQEKCNGKDDDCDGATDAADAEEIVGGFMRYDPQACGNQIGVCAGAMKPASLCVDGVWKACGGAEYEAHDAAYEAGGETLCDGLDNDCSGAIDEDFSVALLNGQVVTGVGTACGVGACKGGTTACAADGKRIECPSEANRKDEVCNGADDDCDGATDAADTGDVVGGYLVHDPQACEIQAGVCAGAKKPATLCVDGKWQACGTAQYTAHSTKYQAEAEKSCDGLDNDCSGEADEDFSVTLLDGSTLRGAGKACGAGACSGGTTACKADQSGIACPTESKASHEKCVSPEADEDCDGLADANDLGDVVNGFLLWDQPACALQAGACAGSKKPAALCVNGQWQGCTSVTYAAQSASYDGGIERRCDGADNDCDASTDEDFSVTLLDGTVATGVGASCGTGRCAGGKTACTADKTGIDCPFELKAAPEVCGTGDDDCDGKADAADTDDVVAGYFRYDLRDCEVQNGVCGGAKKPAALCVGGSWQQCGLANYQAHSAGTYEPGKEIHCDGLDNDCNGSVDEDFSVQLLNGVTATQVGATCGVGRCANGQIACTADRLGIYCTKESLASAEVCNAVDDDCDGMMDAADANDVVNGFLRYDAAVECELKPGVCSGAKKPAALCSNGGWLPCQAAQYVSHNPAYEANVERHCDGLDNDCNGAVDEDFTVVLKNGASVSGVGKTCGVGACAGGVTKCAEDTEHILCDNESRAGNEVCNGADDDCDGKTDAADANDIVGGFFLYDTPPCENQAGVCIGARKNAVLCAGGRWNACGAAQYGANSGQYQDGAEASCDALDNDCDGAADEDFSLVQLNGAIVTGVGQTCGTGICAGSKTACRADKLGTRCPFESNARAETCNGLDDSCNGQTDETYTDKGKACDGGDPDSCKTGTYTCKADGSGVECVNETGTSAEKCNGADDDCDTLVDEDFPTKGAACDGSDGDLCKRGTYTCNAAGTGVECVNESPANIQETCNGQDDDCDGATDETFTTKGQPCDGSDGDACKNGTFTCKADGTAVECVNESPANLTEKCNGADDDCDAATDEDFTDKGKPCDGADTDWCKNGTYTCKADGYGVECVNESTQNIVDRCNGLDDDCDSLTDEDYPTKGQACDGPDADQCKNGTFTCKADGSGVECVNDATPQTETCNGLDDDCDGATDEDFPTKGQACDGADADQCKNGTLTCKANGTGLECVNESPAGITEKCNGLDDDCDTLVDEDFPTKGQACDGPDADQCKGGTFTCLANGTGVECVNDNVGNKVERCNGLDDDCDGLTDEDFPTKGQACDGSDPDQCKMGTNTCKADGSAVECVNETASYSEKCNGLDDDCDTLLDEDFPTKGQACDGSDADQCKGGTFTCKADGSTVECVNDTVGNKVEKCGGGDEDCDGMTDAADTNDVVGGYFVHDQPSCENQYGVCSGSKKPASLCSGGVWQACTNVTYAAYSTFFEAGVEVHCDGKDNDCSNSTDEDFTMIQKNGQPVSGVNAVCGFGACAGTKTACAANQLGIVCPGEANATTETCNGTDQDCDNVADANDSDADVACAVVPHGTGECAGAGTACSVKTCDATWGNVNGTYGDGCECQQDAFDVQGKGPTCAAAWDLGTLSDEVSGAQLATPDDSNTVLPASDEDWYKFTIADTLQNGTWASHGTEKFGFVVELDSAISDSCVRFQVYSDCSTVGTCNGSASPGNLRTFESAFTGAYGSRDCVAEAQWNCCAAGACQAGGTASACCETAGAACGVPTDAHAVTVCSALPAATYYVKVYRSATAPCSNTGITCTNTRYKLKVRNKF